MSSSTIAPTVKSTVILIKRVVVGTLLSVGFAVVVWFDSLGLVQTVPGVWLIPVALAAAFVATEELLRLFETRGIMPKPWLVRCGVAIVVLSAFVDYAGIHAQGGIGDVAAALTLTIIAIMGTAAYDYQPNSKNFERLAFGIFVVVYVGFFMSMICRLRFVDLSNGILPLVSMIAVVKAGDIAAYIIGSVAGRHRFAPSLSPGKTWEGVVASLAASIAMSWFFFHGNPLNFVPRSGHPWGGWMVYGVALGLAGICGDLFESLLKRDMSAKDSGGILPGLGGVLDLLDSLLAAGPLALLLWSWSPSL